MPETVKGAAAKADSGVPVDTRNLLVEIVENTPDFVGILTPDGRIIYINESFRKIVPPQMRGHGLSEHRFADFQPPKIAQMVIEEAIPYAIKHGSWEGRTEILDTHGDVIPVAQTILTHTDSAGTLQFLSTVCRDLRPLMKAETLTDAILETMYDVLFLVGADGRTRFVSPSVERVLGYTPKELLQRGLHMPGPFDDIHPDERNSLTERFEKVIQTPNASDRGIVRYRHKDGHWVTIEYTQINHLHDPALEGVVVIFRDITPRLDAERKRLPGDAPDTTQELERLNRVMVDREVRIAELKRENEELKRRIAESAA